MNKSSKIWGVVCGIVAIFVLTLSTLIGFIPILLLGLIKLFPNQRVKLFCTRCVDVVASTWISANNFYISKAVKTPWEVTGRVDLSLKGWYLVIANHQSWLDIVVLQRLFNRKIPVLKFFIKDQLKWMPFLGFAWWAMGCPFMKRYSKSYLEKNPHKKGKDVNATQRALRLSKLAPASIMSFIEGTRYTPEKKQSQNSPYQHLLRPKAGGISFVISNMHKQITQLLDITIIYPEHQNSLWKFLCHRVDSIKIHIRHLPIPDKFLNSTRLDEEAGQLEFREWLNQQWQEKDKLISALKEA